MNHDRIPSPQKRITPLIPRATFDAFLHAFPYNGATTDVVRALFLRIHKLINANKDAINDGTYTITELKRDLFKR